MKKKKIVVNKASVIARAIAFGIDWYLSALCMNLAIVIISSIYNGKLVMTTLISELPLAYAILCLALGIILVLLYFALPHLLKPTYNGQTLGKILTRIRVVKTNNDAVDIKTLMIRYGIGFILIEQVFNEASYSLRSVISMLIGEQTVTILYYIFCAIGTISVIFLFLNKDGQMLHDKLSKTKVIEVK